MRSQEEEISSHPTTLCDEPACRTARIADWKVLPASSGGRGWGRKALDGVHWRQDPCGSATNRCFKQNVRLAVPQRIAFPFSAIDDHLAKAVRAFRSRRRPAAPQPPQAERERRRSEILAAVDAAQASIDRGEGLAITQQSMRELSDDVKRRGRERLAAEHRTTTTR
jgi:hypothetical protein